MKRLLAITFLVSGLSQASIADEFEEKARLMIELSNSVEPTVEMMDEMVRSLQPMMINQMISDLNDQGKSVKRDTIVALVNEWREVFIEKFSERMVPMLVAEHRKFFTLEEMDQILAMMQQPAFQMYAERTPQIMKSAGEAGERLGQEMGQKILLDLIAKYPSLQ